MSKPRFDLHERVETPRQGIGRIVAIWPNKARGKPTYGVAIDGRTAAIIFNESELRSAPALPEGAVYCRDCAHARISHFAAGSRRCDIYRHVKAAHSPRQCSAYRAQETT